MYKSKISKDFRARVAELEQGFPAAGKWLRDLGTARFDGYWLSTAKNAHLYFRDGFYMYVKLSKFAIEIHSRKNCRIHRGTVDQHHLLFVEPIEQLIARLSSVRSGWASELDDGYLLNSHTPGEFFEGLLDLVQEVHLDAPIRSPLPQQDVSQAYTQAAPTV